MKVVEDDAFIMVKPRSSGIMPSHEEEDEYEEEIRRKEKRAEKLMFLSDTFKLVETTPIRKERHDSDESPPLQNSRSSPLRKEWHVSDESLLRRKRHDSNESPPLQNERAGRQRLDSDESPPRRKRHDSDESPPRRNHQSSRKGRHDSSELSRSRNHRLRRHDSDVSPPRRTHRSPSRKERPHSSESSPRRNSHSSKRNKSRDSDDHSFAVIFFTGILLKIFWSCFAKILFHKKSLFRNRFKISSSLLKKLFRKKWLLQIISKSRMMLQRKSLRRGSWMGMLNVF